MVGRVVILVSFGTLFGRVVGAQTRATQSTPDTTRCDSIVAAAKVDTQQVALFVTATRTDGFSFSIEQAQAIATSVATAFVPPRPFRISVFAGPAQMRFLRRMTADTTSELRAPTVTGVYRFVATKTQPIARLGTTRSSLIPDFDSAAVEAIRAALAVEDVARVPDGGDSMRVEIRFSSDSTASSRRLVTAVFPRMRVVDAVPRRDNPAPVFPAPELVDSASTGDVLLRFVVDRTGEPALETVEVVRATALEFLRAALVVLPKQRFAPATISGCAVAQVVFYPFTFVMPDGANRPP